MMDVFKNHDKSKFDIFGFSHGVDIKNDKWRIEVKSYLTQFIDIKKVSDKEAQNIARNLELDIAIDLSGLTGNPRINIFESVASIQINYLGYPGTYGANYIDYIITDETVVFQRNDLKFYSEKVLYLPECYQSNMKSREVTKKDFKRIDFGLQK